MFVIQWIYTLVNLGLAIILYFYIGQVSPGLPLGKYSQSVVTGSASVFNKLYLKFK